MLTHSGKITNSLWAPSRRPTLFPLFRCFFTSSNDFVSSSSSTASHVDDDYKDFLPWLQLKAGAEFSTALHIGNSPYGRGLYASKNIKKGDCVLKVPTTAQLSPEDLDAEISELIKKEIGNIAVVAVVILFEKQMGEKSNWAPYISRLPLREDMHCSIFWSDEELEMIRPSCAYAETHKQKESIERDFLGLKLVFDKFPHLFQDPTLEGFTHAYGLVRSRAWESSKGVSLIPFLDFLNHDGNSEARVIVCEHDEYSEVTADRDYAKGEEVLIRYGKISNAALLLCLGFTLSNNKYDFVKLELDVPKDDQLCSQKSDILQCLHTPSMKADDMFVCSWNSFKIKQGKGIPRTLRVFARILVCDSQQQLDELREKSTQIDGWLARFPLENKEKEIAAHQFLHSTISELVEEHNEHIKLLEPCTPNIKRQLALDLLQGELRVMKSAIDWLENYCLALSDD
ncbi:hypothetical protein ACS0TY_012071 [Phlomoides rotata]